MRVGGVIGAVGCALLLALPAAGQVMYGCTTGGEFGTVDQVTGEFTLIGDATPSSDDSLSGIAFDNVGRLFGSVTMAGGTRCCSTLIEINPATGSPIAQIGPIRDGSNADVRIVDLAAQPGTGVLFGIDRDSSLYTLNKSTAVATLIGNTGLDRGGIGFAPNGSLYLATVGGDVVRLDPATAQPVGSALSTSEGYDGLAVRPADGLLFATERDGTGVFSIHPVSGEVTTLIGTKSGTTSDLAFQLTVSQPVPAVSPLALALLAAALVMAGWPRVLRAHRL